MIRKLHRWVARQKARKAFLAYTADIDRRIAEARAGHQPTAHLVAEKRRIVHATVRA